METTYTSYRYDMIITKEDLLKRIHVDPNIMVGKPVIRGTRLTVGHILGLLADGWTFPEIQAEHRKLTEEDIAACLVFAQETVDHATFVPLVGNC